MANDYKLCPKCSNAIDFNVSKCPYCGGSVGISFGAGVSNNSGFGEGKLPSTEKKSSGCGCGCLIFIIFIFLIIGGSIISSLFEELDGQELSELKEIVTQEFGDILGVEDSGVNDSNEIVVQEENDQRVLNSGEMLAIDIFDDVFENIKNLNYPSYQDKDGWNVKLGTSTSENINGFRRNIVILKHRGLEFKRYFLELDQENLVFFFDDENNNIHRVTENEVLDEILPVFRESLSEAEQ